MIDTKYFNLLYDDKIITGEESPINFVGENGFIVINFVQSDFIHVHLRFKVKNFDSIGYHDILSMIPYIIFYCMIKSMVEIDLICIIIIGIVFYMDLQFY